MKWVLLLWMMAAGALGTLCRVLLTWGMQWLVGTSFPWGTLLVNVLGSFLFGLVWGITAPATERAMEIRIVVLSGFMGAFTTFSTFAFEVVDLSKKGNAFHALNYITLQLVLGVAAAALGIFLAQWLLAGRTP